MSLNAKIKIILEKAKNIKWNFFAILYGRSLIRLIHESYSLKASALSFVTIVNLVPTLSIMAYLTTHLPQFSTLLNQGRKYVTTNFLPSSSNMIAKHLDTFAYQASLLPTLSILFLVFSVIMMGMTIQDALNGTWTKKKTKKTMLRRTFDWLLLILTPFFIGASLVLSSYLFSASWTEERSLFGMGPILSLVLSLSFTPIINSCVFTLFYSAVSSYKTSWIDRFVGGFTAAFLFEIGQVGFSFYVAHRAEYQQIYGALSAIPLFLLWLYISWFIIIFGALVIDTHNQLTSNEDSL